MILNIIVSVVVLITWGIGSLLMMAGKKQGDISVIVTYLIGNKFTTFGNIVFIIYCFIHNTMASNIIGGIFSLFAINGIFIDSVNWSKIKQIMRYKKNNDIADDNK